MLTKVPKTETRIVKKPLGIRNPIGIIPRKVKTIKHWYTPDIILTTMFPKKDKANGGMNKNTTIPMDIIKIIGSSNEMTLSPGESLAATSITTIDIISVSKTRRNLFNIVMAPFFIHVPINGHCLFPFYIQRKIMQPNHGL
jgi:hypothetical protein